MTRAGSLLWKEWRDHRAAMIVFAAMVPLVSWPVQRYIFKFEEPHWTWFWMIPICVGLSLAVVASDAFAMDLATSRMPGFSALPVPLSRHFTARTAFLAIVGTVFTVWTAVVNATIVGVSGKPGAASVLLLGDMGAAVTGLLICAAATAGVVLFSTLGIGGLRAVFGGALLAGLGFFAMHYVGNRIDRVGPGWPPPKEHIDAEWAIVAGVLIVAAYAAFVGSRGHVSRRRGVAFAAALLVLPLGVPAVAATRDAWRGWNVSPTDPRTQIVALSVSPDGHLAAIVGQSNGGIGAGTYRSWIVRIDDGVTYTWPRRNDYAAGWTTDGLVWMGNIAKRKSEADDCGWYARAETGERVGVALNSEIASRLASGWSIGAKWTHWMRWECTAVASQRPGVHTSNFHLKAIGTDLERTIEACSMPAPMPRVGEVLFVTPERKLALIDLAGGEPRIVADDARAVSAQMAGSPDGRFHIVQTSAGTVVLEAGSWRTVAGPFTGQASVYWCEGSEQRAVLCVSDEKYHALTKLVDVAAGREIPVHRSLELALGYRSIHMLADGRFVARSGYQRVLLLSPDGKFIRQLFPPEE